VIKSRLVLRKRRREAKIIFSGVYQEHATYIAHIRRENRDRDRDRGTGEDSSGVKEIGNVC
jgi:hypothetical protein